MLGTIVFILYPCRSVGSYISNILQIVESTRDEARERADEQGDKYFQLQRGDQEVSAYNVGGVRAFTCRISPDTPWEGQCPSRSGAKSQRGSRTDLRDRYSLSPGKGEPEAPGSEAGKRC